MQVSFRPYYAHYDMSEWLCIHSITPIHHLCGFNSKEAWILKEYISGLTHTAMERGSPRLY